MLGECEAARIDGDGGVSMIVVVVVAAAAGESAMGPTRRATFGGGLKLVCKIKFQFFIKNMMRAFVIII